MSEQRKHRAVEEARAEAAASAAALRAELHARLMEAEERAKVGARAVRCETEHLLSAAGGCDGCPRSCPRRMQSRGKARLEQELNQMRKTMQATLQEMAEMKQKYEDVMKLMQEESSFSKVRSLGGSVATCEGPRQLRCATVSRAGQPPRFHRMSETPLCRSVHSVCSVCSLRTARRAWPTSRWGARPRPRRPRSSRTTCDSLTLGWCGPPLF